MSDLELELVIPCFNEELNLPRLFREIETVVDQEVGFILVNNGSTDNSSKLLSSFCLSHAGRNSKFLNLDENVGYGGGIKAGLRLASARTLGWIHADLQVGIAAALDVAKLLNGLESGLAKGARPTSSRTIVERIFTAGLEICSRILTGYRAQDANGQPKVFTADLLPRVLAGPDNFTLDTHLLLSAIHDGVPLVTREIGWFAREGGHSSWNHGLKSRMKVANQYLRFLFDYRKSLRRHSAGKPSSGKR